MSKVARTSQRSTVEPSWKKNHATFLAEAGIEGDVEVKPWPGISSEREKHLVACVCAVKENPESLVIDVSQSLSRKAFGLPWPTLTTSSHIFCVREGRPLLPREHFYMLGYSRFTSFEGLSPAQLRNLAGEAVAPPSAAFVSYALMLHLQGLWEHY